MISLIIIVFNRVQITYLQNKYWYSMINSNMLNTLLFCRSILYQLVMFDIRIWPQVQSEICGHIIANKRPIWFIILVHYPLRNICLVIVFYKFTMFLVVVEPAKIVLLERRDAKQSLPLALLIIPLFYHVDVTWIRVKFENAKEIDFVLEAIWI